jgi:hypothetical protein
MATDNVLPRDTVIGEKGIVDGPHDQLGIKVNHPGARRQKGGLESA